MKRLAWYFYYILYFLLCKNLPRHDSFGKLGRLSTWLRYKTSSKIVAEHNGRFYIDKGVDFNPRKLFLDNHAALGRNLTIEGQGSVYIGKNANFGPDCMIITSDHNYHGLGNYKKFMEDIIGDVRIGEWTWIGARTIILKGVEIGEKSVIGAASVVTRSVPPYSVYAGVPAKFIKSIDISKDQ